MIIITTKFRGSETDAMWGDFYTTGRNGAEAVSKMLKKIAKAKPDLIGTPFYCASLEFEGIVGDTTKKRIRRKAPSAMEGLDLQGGRMNAGVVD